MSTETNTCPFLEGCPIFKHFRRYAQQIYIDIYCQGDYEICKRRQLRLEGQAVPENLLPHGGTLWDGDQRKV